MQQSVESEESVEKVEEAPLGMHPRHSLYEYPRKDNLYRKKQSFNFDMVRAKIFERK